MSSHLYLLAHVLSAGHEAKGKHVRLSRQQTQTLRLRGALRHTAILVVVLGQRQSSHGVRRLKGSSHDSLIIVIG